MTSAAAPFAIYGLTGGIASGKSKVGEILRGRGVEIVDADAIARGLRAPGAAGEAPILARFGTIDSAKLRAIIAKDPTARRDLEAILHPLILAESRRRFDDVRARRARGESRAPYAIYEAALLVEAGRAGDFAGVILVESADDTRLQRLIARDGMAPDGARQFLGAQPSPEMKLAAATHRIRNDGSLEDLTAKVLRLDEALRRGEKSFLA